MIPEIVEINGIADYANYSDGDEVENRIAAIIDSCSDVSSDSDELESYISDWPTFYHLSKARKNILKPINLDGTLSVLEVGAGCGVLTRALAESVSRVDTLDGSHRRCKIAASRCRGMKNVNIFHGNFFEFHPNQKYDLILFVGVMEYAGLYCADDNPFSATLKHALSMITETGRIAIAIENKNGLKYYCGSEEDHHGKKYYGINNLYDKHEPNTYGLDEIQRMILNEGSIRIRTFYPHPDYKHPQLIVTEKGIERNSSEVAALLSDYDSRIPVTNTEVMYPSMIWRNLAENNLLRSMMNSFLIVLSRSIESSDDDIIADYYSAGRRRGYEKSIKFINDSNNKNPTVKVATLQEGIQESKIVESEFLRGSTLHYHMQRCLAKNDIEKYKDYISHWKDLVVENLADDYSQSVNSKYYDLLPINIILVENEGRKLEVFDQEWEVKYNVTFEFLLIRYMLGLVDKQNWCLYRDYSGEITRDIYNRSIVEIMKHEKKVLSGTRIYPEYAYFMKYMRRRPDRSRKLLRIIKIIDRAIIKMINVLERKLERLLP